MIISFHPLKQETESNNSDTFQESGMVLAGLFVNITDVNGMLPSLTITLQDSSDGENWYNVGNIYVTRTTAGTSVSRPAALAVLADYVRIVWTISGSNNPNFTFSADLVTHKANR